MDLKIDQMSVIDNQWMYIGIDVNYAVKEFSLHLNNYVSENDYLRKELNFENLQLGLEKSSYFVLSGN